MTRPTLCALPVALMLAVLAQGCVAPTRPAPEKSYYVIEANRPERSPVAPERPVLVLAESRMARPFGVKSFIYRVERLRYETDFYNEFFAQPGDMLAGETLDWIEDAGLFRVLARRTPHRQGDLALRLAGNALYGDYRHPGQPLAVLELEVTLETTGRPAEVVFRETYRRETPLSGPGPAALATGWSEALEQILGELEADLGALDLDF